MLVCSCLVLLTDRPTRQGHTETKLQETRETKKAFNNEKNLRLLILASSEHQRVTLDTNRH